MTKLKRYVIDLLYRLADRLEYSLELKDLAHYESDMWPDKRTTKTDNVDTEPNRTVLAKGYEKSK